MFSPQQKIELASEMFHFHIQSLDLALGERQQLRAIRLVKQYLGLGLEI